MKRFIFNTALPATLQGDEAVLLGFYSDPKVRALLSSMGKYEKLKAREK